MLTRWKNKVVVITGMTGAGKDYLVARANQHLQLTTIGWGDLLAKELGANKDIMMNTIAPDRIKEGQFAVCNKVLSLQPVLAICHVIKPEEGHYVYNLAIEQLLNPQAYVFIKAPAKVIAQRVRKRNFTDHRQAAEIPVQEIDRVQSIKLDAIRRLCQIQRTTLLVLNNVDHELSTNLNQLNKVASVLKTDSFNHKSTS